MRVLHLLYVLPALLMISCSGDDKDSTRNSDEPIEFATPIPKTPGQADLKTYKTRSDKRFIVIEKTNSQNKRRITVQGMNFPNSEEIFTFNDSDPIEKGLMADLDRDGFEELYLITRSTNSQAEVTILAFTSENDDNYSQIYVPRADPNEPNFRGTKGHSQVSVRGDRLMRQIPIYAQGDHITRPSGGMRMISYALEKNKSQYELVPKEVTTHK